MQPNYDRLILLATSTNPAEEPIEKVGGVVGDYLTMLRTYDQAMHLHGLVEGRVITVCFEDLTPVDTTGVYLVEVGEGMYDTNTTVFTPSKERANRYSLHAAAIQVAWLRNDGYPAKVIEC